MDINTSPPRRTGGETTTMKGPWKTLMTINTRPPEATTYKPTYADTPPDIDFKDRHGYSPTVSPDTVRRYESAISDLTGHGFEEEDYPVVRLRVRPSDRHVDNS